MVPSERKGSEKLAKSSAIVVDPLMSDRLLVLQAFRVERHEVLDEDPLIHEAGGFCPGLSSLELHGIFLSPVQFF